MKRGERMLISNLQSATEPPSAENPIRLGKIALTIMCREHGGSKRRILDSLDCLYRLVIHLLQARAIDLSVS